MCFSWNVTYRTQLILRGRVCIEHTYKTSPISCPRLCNTTASQCPGTVMMDNGFCTEALPTVPELSEVPPGNHLCPSRPRPVSRFSLSLWMPSRGSTEDPGKCLFTGQKLPGFPLPDNLSASFSLFPPLANQRWSLT